MVYRCLSGTNRLLSEPSRGLTMACGTILQPTAGSKDLRLSVVQIPIEILRSSVSHESAFPEPQLPSRLGSRGCSQTTLISARCVDQFCASTCFLQ